jgi:AcrR family transcriptional regulator
MVTHNLGRDDWMRAARRALLTGGPEAVRIEPLALALGVTKGSFYWHFTDRRALLDALIREWEEERSIALAELPLVHGPAAVRALMDFLKPRVVASERGEIPSDAAIFAWAATDSTVARRVNAAEAERVAFMQELVGDAHLGEFLYLAYLGFVMRRRRVPSTAAFFPTFARLSEAVTAGARRKRDRNKRTLPAIAHAPPARDTNPASRRER